MASFCASTLLYRWRNEANIIRKADESVVFMEQPEENEADILQRWFRDSFAEGKVEENERRKEENLRWSFLLFRKGVPNPGQRDGQPIRWPKMATELSEPITEKEYNEVEAMWSVLGYRMRTTGNEDLDRRILGHHRLRMKDVLGWQALRTKEHCQKNGIWCAELGANDFFVLWQHRFAIGEEAFNKETRAGIEERVKRKLAEKKQSEEKELFGSRWAGTRAMIGPEEMRDMVEESVARVRTREN
jgi:hypothetical protein